MRKIASKVYLKKFNFGINMGFEGAPVVTPMDATIVQILRVSNFSVKERYVWFGAKI